MSGNKLFCVRRVVEEVYYIEAPDLVEAERIEELLWAEDAMMDKIKDTNEVLHSSVTEADAINEDQYWTVYLDGKFLDMR